MDSKSLHDEVSFKVSKLANPNYCISFALAVSFWDKEMQKAIYRISGLLRSADEIGNTTMDYSKTASPDKFETDHYEAHQSGISLNLILHSFQPSLRYTISGELFKALLAKALIFDKMRLV